MSSCASGRGATARCATAAIPIGWSRRRRTLAPTIPSTSSSRAAGTSRSRVRSLASAVLTAGSSASRSRTSCTTSPTTSPPSSRSHETPDCSPRCGRRRAGAGPSFPPHEVFPLYSGYADGFWAGQGSTWDDSFRDHFRFTHNWDDPGVGGDFREEGVEIVVRDVDPEFPPATCELGGGMATAYHRRPIARGRDIAALANVKIGNGSAWQGFYMYVGGTNPADHLQEIARHRLPERPAAVRLRLPGRVRRDRASRRESRSAARPQCLPRRVRQSPRADVQHAARRRTRGRARPDVAPVGGAHRRRQRVPLHQHPRAARAALGLRRRAVPDRSRRRRPGRARSAHRHPERTHRALAAAPGRCGRADRLGDGIRRRPRRGRDPHARAAGSRRRRGPHPLRGGDERSHRR